MDTTNLHRDHPCYVAARKKKPVFFSDEVDGNKITEFCSLRTKSYAFHVYSKDKSYIYTEGKINKPTNAIGEVHFSNNGLAFLISEI